MNVSNMVANLRNSSFSSQHYIAKSTQVSSSFAKHVVQGQDKKSSPSATDRVSQRTLAFVQGDTASLAEEIAFEEELLASRHKSAFAQRSSDESGQEQFVMQDGLSLQEMRERDKGIKQYKQVASYIYNPCMLQRSVMDAIAL